MEEVKQKLGLLPDKCKQFLFVELAEGPADSAWAPCPLLRPASLATEGEVEPATSTFCVVVLFQEPGAAVGQGRRGSHLEL